MKHALPAHLISRKIKISFLRCLGPRCSRRRTCGRTGQQRNDLDARRCRECRGIDTNGSACAVPPPTPESRPDERHDRPPPLARSFAKFDCAIFGQPPMNTDKNAEIPATEIAIYL